MMNRQPGDHAIEFPVIERQVLRVAGPKRDVGEGRFGAARFRLFQHWLGGVERHDRAGVRRQLDGDHARPASDVEQLAAPRVAECRAEAAGIVGLRRPSVEILRLPRKLIRDAFEVIHIASFRCALAAF